MVCSRGESDSMEENKISFEIRLSFQALEEGMRPGDSLGASSFNCCIWSSAAASAGIGGIFRIW